MSKVGVKWTRRIGGCDCCGGDAWVLEGLAYPQGSATPYIRCDVCRMNCNFNKRGECRTVVAE